MKIQIIEKELTAPNQTVTITDDLDKDYKHLTGIAVLESNGTGHILVTSDVQGVELFPKDFEVDFIQSNSYVAPNDRFFDVENFPAAGNKIELVFKDAGTIPAASFPYTARFYLRLENKCNG